MGIWIRSQLQKGRSEEFVYAGLVNCNWFAMRRLSGNYQIDGGINDPNDEDGGFLLGAYPSEDEAIKVLDMIQERIDLTKPEFVLMQGQTFQMPEAGFSEKEG